MQHQTNRLQMYALEKTSNRTDAKRVVLVHGNVSSSVYYKPLMAKLPEDWHVIAPDLRGYGGTEPKPLDGTRGLRDFSDDVWSLLETLGWTSDVHLVGWSMGGGVIMQLAMDYPNAVGSLTLIAPVSPYGFGGTHGAEGTPNAPDYAGSGGGTVNADFVKAVAAGDKSDGPLSPRGVMKAFYFKPDFALDPALEEAFLESALTTRCGEDHYPGDLVPSAHWPMVAPGTRGVANAFSPKYMNLSGFANINPKPPVLWVHGAFDQIVSDTSSFDLAFLGQLGVVPGWPGAEACPPQPMKAQMRAVLDAYKQNGGSYTEVLFENSAHAPHIEEEAKFLELFLKHVDS